MRFATRLNSARKRWAARGLLLFAENFGEGNRRRWVFFVLRKPPVQLGREFALGHSFHLRRQNLQKLFSQKHALGGRQCERGLEDGSSFGGHTALRTAGSFSPLPS